jgi:hypothetical protein
MVGMRLQDLPVEGLRLLQAAGLVVFQGKAECVG